MAQSISITIGGRKYPVNATSPENEALIRNAAGEVNRKLEQYLEKFPGKTDVELLSFVALNVCKAHLLLKEEMSQLVSEGDTLADELKGYLDNIDKDSR